MKKFFVPFRLISVFILISLLLPASLVQANLPLSISPDPYVQEMLDQVTSETVLLYDRQLAGELPVFVDGENYTITTRYTYSGTPIQKATHYVGQHLQSLGMNVEYHVWNADTNPNVIGEIVGRTHPEQIFIIGAHLDAVQGAPGADDNASGSVAVLIAADILSQYQWDCTLRFAFWTGEEQGLYGSAAYAQRALSRGENIIGYLNLDMIAYNTLGSTPGIDLVYHPSKPSTQALAQLFADVVDAYDLNLVPQLVADSSNDSDHASFWNRGYTSILAIEDFDDFNPYYHTSNDTPAHNNLPYFTEFVKASLATFVHECDCLITGEAAGLVTDAETGLPLAGAVVDFGNGSEHHLATTDANGQYHLMLFPGIYVVRVSRYGYAAFEQSGISVSNGELTTFNAALTALPYYTLSGVVTQAGTGLPLAATLTFDGSPEVVFTDMSTGAYSVSLPQGNYTAHVRAAMHTPLAQDFSLSANATLDFTLTPYPPVLLVDDDQNSPNLSGYYTQALADLGIDYNVWDVSLLGSPTADDLVGYCHVVWYNGAPATNTLSAEDEAALAAYLDGGGSLFFSSHDYLLERGLNNFGSNYLGIASYVNNVRKTDPVGKTGDPIGDGLGPYALSVPAGWTRPLWTDNVTGKQASPFQWVSTGRGNSSRYGAGNFKTVFLAWPLEALASASARAEVLSAALDWFGDCVPSLGQLSGQVLNATDATPIEGAQVSVNPAQGGPALTNPSGFYQLALPAGEYLVTAQATCHQAQTVSVTLGVGGLQTQNFDLVPFPAAVTAAPGSFSVGLPGDGVQQLALTIQNNGCQVLSFDLAENPSVTWMSEEINQGQVLPGGSATVQLSFSAQVLSPGIYQTTLALNSNDPQQPVLSLPVTLTVTPVSKLFLPMLLH
jgi:hypothetical protein